MQRNGPFQSGLEASAYASPGRICPFLPQSHCFPARVLGNWGRRHSDLEVCLGGEGWVAVHHWICQLKFCLRALKYLQCLLFFFLYNLL